MSYVVTENCIRCKYQDCVEVCPVDCFHEGPNMLVIDPDECIDCALCEPECPAEAIHADDDVPSSQKVFVELNRELARQWPVISRRGQAPADADQWQKVAGKLTYLDKGNHTSGHQKPGETAS